MKRTIWRSNRWFKTAAGLLCLTALTFALMFGSQVLWLKGHGVYERDGQDLLMEQVERDLLWDQLRQLEAVCQEEPALFASSSWSEDQGRRTLQPGALDQFDPNFFFTIRSETGRLLYAGGGQSRARVQEATWVELTGPDRETQRERPVGRSVLLTGSIREDLKDEGGISAAIQQAALRYEQRDTLAGLAAVALVVGLLSLGAMIWSAGWRQGQENITLYWLDRVLPLELILLGMALLAAWLVLLADQGLWGPNPYEVTLSVLGMAAFLGLFLSLVRRKKGGILTRESWLIHRLWQKLRPWSQRHQVSPRAQTAWDTLTRWGCRISDHIPMVWKGMAGFVLFWVLEWLSSFLHHPLPWGILKVLEGLLVLQALFGLRALRNGGRRLAQGDPADISLTHLHGAMQEHGAVLNDLWVAQQDLIEDRIQAERMKTELITNVSHDMKTPLTTIQNYVDLLKQEDLSHEQARNYLEILDRQTSRLKKLTENLVDASEAASGQLAADLQPLDVNEFLAQSLNEYEARMQARSLTLVLREDPSQPVIAGDQRLLWRILDNLLSNVEHYAQPGTRVYLSSQVQEDEVELTIRNISAEPINMTAQELMARFARGDASWPAEGSGLGLSIALSLTQLQNGAFDFIIDGDLVKVVLTFPLVLPQEDQGEESEAANMEDSSENEKESVLPFL